eukprot:TRINITY_DN1651_c0_g1_i16.p1 TRINITY_DN1651_c0_g1~~TRINITY_DN1651_c0_g1_i16.p1  ORF type:complete len:102 (-),score=31.26 TRINITY_DN1651_c0_g1_i16:117-422(-)
MCIRDRYNLVSQQTALFKSEQISLGFSDEAINAIAEIAYESNTHTENLGARRLHSLIEKIVEDISFEAPNPEKSEFVLDGEYVRSKLKSFLQKSDLSKYLI